jgi:ribonuclease HI
MPLPNSPTSTNQRAAIEAIILALKKILHEWSALEPQLPVHVTIYTDSQYAIGCMRTWMHTWKKNGFINAKGSEVANRKLIERAHFLDGLVDQLGDTKYVWI